MSKFKVGDRVIGKRDYGGCPLTGKFGTVRTAYEGSRPPIGVEWDADVGGHCGGTYFNCPHGHGYYVSDDCIDVISNNSKILITTAGLTTLARLYEGNQVVKSAKAVCSPEDTFDFAVGAKLAYDRLMGEKAKEEPKPEPAPEPVKLYCVKDIDRGFVFQKGKVYEATHDYRITDENGETTPCSYPSIADHDRGNPSYAGALIPLVGRPAKVGDWVYFVQNWGGPLAEGSVHRVAGDHYGTLSFVGNAASCSVPDAYLVLDGYCPEPETCKCCGQVINK